MSNPAGSFIWYELITPDVGGAKRFYGDLIGWTAQDLPGKPCLADFVGPARHDPALAQIAFHRPHPISANVSAHQSAI